MPNIENKSAYKRIKSKYNELMLSTFDMSEELWRTKKENRQLKKEKSYLIAQIIKMAQNDNKSKRGRKPLSKQAASTESMVAEEANAFVTLHNTDVVMNAKSSTTGESTSFPAPTPSISTPSEPTCIAIIGGGKTCKTRAQSGSQYCWRHAALDPNSDSMYCRYTDPSSKKSCSNTIPKTKKPALCTHHMGKSEMFKGNDWVMNVPGASPPDPLAAYSALSSP